MYVHISPTFSAHWSSGESPPRWNMPSAGSTMLAEPILVRRHDLSPQRLSLGDFNQGRPSILGGGYNPSPPSINVELVGLASEGAQFIDADLSTQFVETILHSRAPAMRKGKHLQWKVLTYWCK